MNSYARFGRNSLLARLFRAQIISYKVVAFEKILNLKPLPEILKAGFFLPTFFLALHI